MLLDGFFLPGFLTSWTSTGMARTGCRTTFLSSASEPHSFHIMFRAYMRQKPLIFSFRFIVFLISPFCTFLGRVTLNPLLPFPFFFPLSFISDVALIYSVIWSSSMHIPYLINSKIHSYRIIACERAYMDSPPLLFSPLLPYLLSPLL